MTEKYTVTLTKEQLLLIARCVEDVHRFASGQWEMQHTVEKMAAFSFPDEVTPRVIKMEGAKNVLRAAKQVLLPDLKTDNSYFSYDAYPFLGNTYALYREIYHKLIGGDNPMNVYSSPTLPSGNMGSIIIEKVQGDEKTN